MLLPRLRGQRLLTYLPDNLASKRHSAAEAPECRSLLGLAVNEKRLRIDAVVLHGIRGGLALHDVLEGFHIGDLGDERGLVGPSGSLNVRTVMPIGPNSSSRFGELSQCSTSSTSWVMT